MSYYHHLIQATLPASYLLDTYTNAKVAFSVRKLSSAYSGNCIKVRRSSDNTEQDIGFVGNVLDTTSLLAFCGAGDGFVTVFYDQSGNALNATQSSSVSQPKIVSSGSVVLSPSTSNPAMHCSVAFHRFEITNFALPANFLQSLVYNRALTNETVGLSGLSSPYPYLVYLSGNDVYINTGSFNLFGASSTGNKIAISYKKSGNNSGIYLNGSQLGSEFNLGVSSGNLSYLFDRAGASGGNYYSECVFWDTDKSADISGININTNTYYGIY
jgi:hypothetical protein